MDATKVCMYLDEDLISFIHNVIVLLKIAVPVLLIILGMLDFAKSAVASKEDEIKKGTQVFIKRVIAGACVFLVVTIVQLVMGLVSKDDASFWNCANQILNGNYNKIQTTDDDDTTACKGAVPAVRKEYNYCLSVSGNEVCNTIFQKGCTNITTSKLWEYNNGSGIKNFDEDYTCKSGAVEGYENFYKRALYSCATDTNSPRSIEECLTLLQPFCRAKNN